MASIVNSKNYNDQYEFNFNFNFNRDISSQIPTSDEKIEMYRTLNDGHHTRKKRNICIKKEEMSTREWVGTLLSVV